MTSKSGRHHIDRSTLFGGRFRYCIFLVLVPMLCVSLTLA